MLRAHSVLINIERMAAPSEVIIRIKVQISLTHYDCVPSYSNGFMHIYIPIHIPIYLPSTCLLLLVPTSPNLRANQATYPPI